MPEIAALPPHRRAWRVLRHWFATDGAAQRALDPAALARIAERVRGSESRHRGEIRICVEGGLPWSYLWKGLRARHRAVTLFGKLRVWDTEENTGVLVYLLLADHAIELLADRGLNARVPPETWAGIVGRMRETFRAGHFEQGLVQAVESVEALLVEHFPARPGEANPNELPDAVDLR